jgi:hypothetical protein
VAHAGDVAQQRAVTGAEPAPRPVTSAPNGAEPVQRTVTPTATAAEPVQQSVAPVAEPPIINGHAGMQPASGSLPAADWYPDPAGSGKERYWDGAAWTGELQGKPAGGSGALGILGLLTALFVAPIGIVIGLLLVAKGQRKDGWIVVGIGSAILLAILIGTQ